MDTAGIFYSGLLDTATQNWLSQTGTLAANGDGSFSFTDPDGNASALTDSSPQITNNTASSNGGGLFMTGNGWSKLKNTTLQNNKATGNGGGAYAENTSQLFVRNVTCQSNSAGSGGGIYVAGGKGFAYDSTLIQNTASANGGGIYVGTSSFVFSKGLNRTYNKSVLGKGGGAYVLGQFITAEVEVHYNSAAVAGGGVCVE
ncbi:MAG: hypothetical protein FWF59_08780 [Turicibacter sp.]|nr:hypothetical protein [Turicibacter sp.]